MEYLGIFLGAFALLSAGAAADKVRRLDREVEQLKAELRRDHPPSPDARADSYRACDVRISPDK